MRLNILVLFLFLLLLSILNGHFFQWFIEKYFDCDISAQDMGEASPTLQAVIIVIIAPIVETYLFIELPNDFLDKVRLKNIALRILFCSLIFGAVHFYCWGYVLMTFVAGLMMNILYANAKFNRLSAFWVVALYHSLYNLYGYLFVK